MKTLLLILAFPALCIGQTITEEWEFTDSVWYVIVLDTIKWDFDYKMLDTSYGIMTEYGDWSEIDTTVSSFIMFGGNYERTMEILIDGDSRDTTVYDTTAFMWRTWEMLNEKIDECAEYQNEVYFLKQSLIYQQQEYDRLKLRYDKLHGHRFNENGSKSKKL